MKIQKYIVTIEMPDGDMISSGWLKDLIQTDCNIEDEGRDKVFVEELSEPELPSNLDEAAVQEHIRMEESVEGLSFLNIFKAGAEWQMEQVVTLIESRLAELIGDAQPTPILRVELQEIIKRIKEKDETK
jgi:hypothetical protein